MSNRSIKVLIVDDSALIRALLHEIIDAHPQLEVCDVAIDPYDAREKIKKLNPDVITLDIEMPKMNGISFLKNLMRLRPMPVVMISTLTQEGAPATLQALELGAIDFVAKPKSQGGDGLERYADEICQKVIAAARANLSAISTDFANATAVAKAIKVSGIARQNFICAIGASTGGTEAIKDVVSVLPKNGPPVVVTQHIPENFSASFAKRVNGVSSVHVCEAAHGQIIEPGNVYIAPGHSHLRVVRKQGDFTCALDKGELINRHRPAVEPLFDSVREATKGNCMGVLLTGMGTDGAEALLRMKRQDIATIAQDEASSIVWGMPRAAVQLGAAAKVLALGDIAKEIVRTYFEVL